MHIMHLNDRRYRRDIHLRVYVHHAKALKGGLRLLYKKIHLIQLRWLLADLAWLVRLAGSREGLEWWEQAKVNSELVARLTPSESQVISELVANGNGLTVLSASGRRSGAVFTGSDVSPVPSAVSSSLLGDAVDVVFVVL
jgi:hypothetical protein